MLQRPKGTKDLLPNESYKWQYVEKKVQDIFENTGFKEIRVPVFEYTELFQRGVGQTTDVVQKEMYTFEDKGGRSITLRPEGTAGTIRAYLENGIFNQPSPTKLWYNMGMYRYENVQKGRLREFHQFGTELIGSSSYLADVEIILLGNRIFEEFGIKDIKLFINSIGCKECRANYQKALKEFIGMNIENYCSTCKSRFDKNPMRILDCKEKKCKEYNIGAPKIVDFLCDECKEHFESVKKVLNNLNIRYEVDTSIVRGLDYYTKTVFEFVNEVDGVTVLGGGRYDGLVEEFDGKPTPAVGFGTGVERLIEVIEKNGGFNEIQPKRPELYIISMGESETLKTIEISEKLRKSGIFVENDIMNRSFKAQMKYADKISAKNLIVIGEEELKTNKVKIKNMATGNEKLVDLSEEDISKNLN